MDIGQFPTVTVHPLRAPSSVEDGEVGQNGNSYRRSPKRNPKEQHEPLEEEQSICQKGEGHFIDILV